MFLFHHCCWSMSLMHTICQVVIHSIRLPKNSTISDVITDLKTKVITHLPFQIIQSVFSFVQIPFYLGVVSVYNLHLMPNRLNYPILTLSSACLKFSITKFIRFVHVYLQIVIVHIMHSAYVTVHPRIPFRPWFSRCLSPFKFSILYTVFAITDNNLDFVCMCRYFHFKKR
jgi:hypothetical protein